MAEKENKGGTLSNEQVEQDLKAKGRLPAENSPYQGAQDTGDKGVRQMGNSVQQRDGLPESEENGER
jgi:hypothetical protein